MSRSSIGRRPAQPFPQAWATLEGELSPTLRVVPLVAVHDGFMVTLIVIATGSQRQRLAGGRRESTTVPRAESLSVGSDRGAGSIMIIKTAAANTTRSVARTSILYVTENPPSASTCPPLFRN
jgi:hypothetical protein